MDVISGEREIPGGRLTPARDLDCGRSSHFRVFECNSRGFTGVSL